MTTIEINITDRPHRLMIERHALKRLGEHVHAIAPHDRAMLVVDARIHDTHGEIARQSLEKAGFNVSVVDLIAEEKRKTLETAGKLYDAMLSHHMERTSPVIALGGGIIGDVAGFAAATYLRGVPIIQAPTTLLAMVDAAIGGKTAVNHPVPGGELGKNLVGAFWQPSLILADPETLTTLDDRDFRCGMAECIKHALIADDDGLREFLHKHAESIKARDMRALETLISHCASIKARIVEADERESGRRMLLNLGHTFAHAIEPIDSLDLRHGEAVAIGLCAAALCAAKLGRVSESYANDLEKLLVQYGLPTRLPQPVVIHDLLRLMRFDKKAAAGAPRVVLPCVEAGVEVVSGVSANVIRATWIELGAVQS